ncbi:Aspartic peptidase domain containing protein [Rhypophila sp. PSN 637]
MVNPLRLAMAGFLANGAVLPKQSKGGPGPNGFSVSQIRNPHFAPYGPAQLAKIYRKYGVPIPENLNAAIKRYRQSRGFERRSTGTVDAVPEASDVEFLSPVYIGTPAQILNVDFDTGSSDFWVFSTETDPNQVAGQILYDPNQSSSAQKMEGATWSILYGDGSSSSGEVYTDTVTIGGVTFASQAVEVATQVSAQFTNDINSDGLVGLGFSNINTVQPQRQNTFFENIIPTLDSPIFTADLKTEETGTYNFGWIDYDAFVGNITYTDVDTSLGSGLWGMNIQGYSITASGASDAHIADNFTASTITGAADTGSTLLLLPRALVMEYYSYIQDSAYDYDHAGWLFPCDADILDFSFGISGTDAEDNLIITIPAKYLSYGEIYTGTDHSLRCYGSIQYDDHVGFPIFGDIALKSAFVVFDHAGGGIDYSKPRIGWARKILFISPFQ